MCRFLALIIILPTFAVASQVIQVGKTGKILLISNDSAPWRVQDSVCINKGRTRAGCGRVVKTAANFAYVKLDTLATPIAKGDGVQRVGNRGIASISQTSIQRPGADTSMRWGMQLGGNFTSLSFGEPTGTSSKTSFVFGPTFEKFFTPQYSIETALLYSKKGGKLEDALGTLDLSYTFLEIPILGKMKFNTGSFKPFVFAGPYFALLMSATADATLYDGTQTTGEDVKGVFVNGPDYGMILGGGFETAISPTILFNFVVRYGYGLANVDATGTVSQKIRTFQVLAGLQFPL